MYGFYPLINKPTRITTESVTLTDNIFTNVDINIKSGLWIADISDHLTIFTILSSKDKKPQLKIQLANGSGR